MKFTGIIDDESHLFKMAVDVGDSTIVAVDYPRVPSTAEADRVVQEVHLTPCYVRSRATA